jgi:preprotein translocase subunit SecD
VPSPDPEHRIKGVPQTTTFDSFLYTGWYYIVDTSDCKRKLDKTSEFYFIDPAPITTVKNIMELKMYKAKDGYFGLSMRLDETGTKAWSIATEKAVGRKLAFILDNRLLHAPTVNLQIEGGVTALNRSDYSKAELENFKTMIESERRENTANL